MKEKAAETLIAVIYSVCHWSLNPEHNSGELLQNMANLLSAQTFTHHSRSCHLINVQAQHSPSNSVYFGRISWGEYLNLAVPLCCLTYTNIVTVFTSAYILMWDESSREMIVHSLWRGGCIVTHDGNIFENVCVGMGQTKTSYVIVMVQGRQERTNQDGAFSKPLTS